MSSDKPDHATLEAQRRRSNVYAFRRLKWGAPKRLRASGARAGGKTPLPFAKRGRGRGLNVALLVAIGFVCGVIAVVALG
jgi:hypothetical protein